MCRQSNRKVYAEALRVNEKQKNVNPIAKAFIIFDLKLTIK